MKHHKLGDQEFLQELDRRSIGFKSGKTKRYNWEEVKARAGQELRRRAKAQIIK